MHHSVIFSLLPLLGLLLVAAGIDLRSRRIPNWLVLIVIVSGLALSFTPYRVVSPGYALLGACAGFGLTAGLYFLKALCGGDVKLLFAVGMWTGPLGVLFIFCVAGIAGMIIVLVHAAWDGRLAKLLHNSTLLAINIVHLNQLGMEHVIATGQSTRTLKSYLPWAVSVTIGVMTLMVWPR
ncbi:MAG TPA: A24 family peptidase [Tepidisphaeraceae bacterium]|jgi:prepilin peptidase CpaA|nr:A24 family peptidase [Tepidisphaeraceae bacterium]